MSERDATFLIIEDHQVVLDSFARLLKAEGHHVVVSSDPASGLAQIEGIAPDALLVDMHAPTFNGLEFVRRLRALPHRSHLPVAIITGDYFLDESVVGELEALGTRVYFKPIWEDDLIRIASDLLAQQQ